MKRAHLLFCIALMIMAALPAAAQEGRIRLTLDALDHKAAEVAEVTLDGPMLQLGIKLLSNEDHDVDAVRVLSQLKGVYVRNYRFDHEGEYSERDLDGIRQQLQAPGWAKVVSVHSRRDSENAEIYVMSGANGVAGLTIVAARPTELSVVNLVGPIDPADLARLSGHFGIPRVDAGSKLDLAGVNHSNRRRGN
jgi:hypothetical protein